MSGERTGAEKLKKRSNPFCEPPMAVIGSKPPEAKKAIGLSLSAEQHLVSLTRKTRPSAASGYQAMFCSQGIKRPAYMPPAFDGLYFLRMYPSYLR